MSDDNIRLVRHKQIILVCYNNLGQVTRDMAKIASDFANSTNPDWVNSIRKLDDVQEFLLEFERAL